MQTAQTLQSPEDVFVALDHYQLRESVIEVLGVHESGADFWVQIGLEQNAHDSRVLRIMRGTDVDTVLQTLAVNPPFQDAPSALRVVPFLTV